MGRETTIGDLNGRIEIKRITLSPDGYGGYTETEKSQGSKWARVRVPQSSTNVIAMKDAEIRTHEFTLRHLSDVQINDIVVYRSSRYVVRGVRHDPLRWWTYLDCMPEVT